MDEVMVEDKFVARIGKKRRVYKGPVGMYSYKGGIQKTSLMVDETGMSRTQPELMKHSWIWELLQNDFWNPEGERNKEWKKKK